MGVRKLLDERQIETKSPCNVEFKQIEKIEFQNVTFKYKERKQIILNNLNLQILAG